MALNVSLKKVASGLISPVDAAFSNNLMYIADQVGKVYLRANGQLQSVLDLSKTINKLKYGFFVKGLIPVYDERGLLGIALHPGFPENPRIYIYYSAPINWLSNFKYNHIGRLSEFQFTDINNIDPKSEKILLEIPQDKASHNGGCLRFGPNQELYLSMGDGGRYLHKFGIAHSQDLSNPLGAILKMALSPKGIAPAQPSKPGIHPLLWAWGLRNPWRFSFDIDGSCYVGAVGESRKEAIYRLWGGENCGWPMFEGSLPFETSFNKSPHDPNTTFTNPIYEYGPDKGRSIIGGFIYRGSRLDLQKLYIFADASRTWPHRMGFKPTGHLYALKQQDGSWLEAPLVVTGLPEGSLITSLAKDNRNNLWVLAKQSFGPSGNTGAVYQII